jgi:hypothetical protein
MRIVAASALCAAIALTLAGAAVFAAEPLPPERAPPAQQTAPPDKIGPPLHTKQPPEAKGKRPETTGGASKGKTDRDAGRRRDRTHPAR